MLLSISGENLPFEHICLLKPFMHSMGFSHYSTNIRSEQTEFRGFSPMAFSWRGLWDTVKQVPAPPQVNTSAINLTFGTPFPRAKPI